MSRGDADADFRQLRQQLRAPDFVGAKAARSTRALTEDRRIALHPYVYNDTPQSMKS